MDDARFWITEQHNRARAAHGVGFLQQSDSLNQNAQKWANYLASTNKFQHSNGDWNGRHVGENIFMAMDSRQSQEQLAKAQAVDSWYGEISKYNFNRPGFSGGTGHFTQVVWRATTQLGIGIASGRGGTYVVCQYFPAGNMQGDFPGNVLPRQSAPDFRCSGPSVTAAQGNNGGDSGSDGDEQDTPQQAPQRQQQQVSQSGCSGGVQRSVQTEVREEWRGNQRVRTTITKTTERYPDGSTRTQTQTSTETF